VSTAVRLPDRKIIRIVKGLCCGLAMRRLDSTVHALDARPFTLQTTMGQQLNKKIKRKRRAAYLKRKKERTKTTAKKK
jgi:hypothetical protein